MTYFKVGRHVKMLHYGFGSDYGIIVEEIDIEESYLCKVRVMHTAIEIVCSHAGIEVISEEEYMTAEVMGS
jgi:hypothetical protein